MKLSNRQFYDIQAMADRIQAGRHEDGEIEAFARFSEDLKAHLIRNVENEMIATRLRKLPHITYEEFHPSLLEYLNINGLSLMWSKRRKRQEIREKVREIASIYSSVHFLLKKELAG